MNSHITFYFQFNSYKLQCEKKGDLHKIIYNLKLPEIHFEALEAYKSLLRTAFINTVTFNKCRNKRTIATPSSTLRVILRMHVPTAVRTLTLQLPRNQRFWTENSNLSKQTILRTKVLSACVSLEMTSQRWHCYKKRDICGTSMFHRVKWSEACLFKKFLLGQCQAEIKAMMQRYLLLIMLIKAFARVFRTARWSIVNGFKVLPYPICNGLIVWAWIKITWKFFLSSNLLWCRMLHSKIGTTTYFTDFCQSPACGNSMDDLLRGERMNALVTLAVHCNLYTIPWIPFYVMVTCYTNIRPNKGESGKGDVVKEKLIGDSTICFSNENVATGFNNMRQGKDF